MIFPFLKKYRVLFVSLGVVFLYSVTLAYAAGGPFSPHQTLDPDCLPTVTTCYVTTPSGGGGTTLGDPITGGNPNQVLYTDASGNLASDANFTRTATNFGITTIPGVGTVSRFYAGDDLIQAGAGLKGIQATYETAQGFNGILGLSLAPFSGPDNATIVGFFNLGGNSANTLYLYDSNHSLGSIHTAIKDANGDVNTDLSSGQGFSITGATTAGTQTALQVNNSVGDPLLEVWDNGAVKIHGAYSFPLTDGINGQTLITDGSGHLSFGTPPNATSLIGQTSGVIVNSGGNNGSSTETWLGYQAGVDTTDPAGFVTTNNTTLIGYHAGQESAGVGIDNSTFIGSRAGENADYNHDSVIIGYQAGRNAWGESQSSYVGVKAGYDMPDANATNLFGFQAGYSAANELIETNGTTYNNGQPLYYLSNSNIFGTYAGYIDTDAITVGGPSVQGLQGASIFGHAAGFDAYNAPYANFFGASAGSRATNAQASEFIGHQAGSNAVNARNSIFIGDSAGFGDTVDNNTIPGTSILIGDNTYTNGYSNSIALGSKAQNTASNQFMIGSTASPINTLILTGAGGNTCVLDVTVSSPSCSSDENLKTNITDLPSVLDVLSKVRTVTYNWKNFPGKATQIGFLAQDLAQDFPSVVSIAPNGFETVSYGGMTPILTKAIQELNMKVTGMTNLATLNNSFISQLITWLGSSTNGITRIFAGNVTTNELCVGTTCVTQDQFLHMVQSANIQPTPTPTPTPTPEPTTPVITPTPIPDTSTPKTTTPPTASVVTQDPTLPIPTPDPALAPVVTPTTPPVITPTN